MSGEDDPAPPTPEAIDRGGAAALEIGPPDEATVVDEERLRWSPFSAV